jgi:hypothetical protein
MEHQIDIVIYENDVIMFHIYKTDTIIRFDLNNEAGSIIFNQEHRASEAEISDIISYLNTFLETKIVYGQKYPINDSIIEQLNAIHNCEASRIVDNTRDFLEDRLDYSSSDEEYSGLWNDRTYTSMCEDD